MSQKILLVESDPSLSALWSQALESRGFAVEALTDAVHCVERARQERPDLVLLSVSLSGGQNGYLVCGKLKKEDALRNLPVIIVGDPDGFAMHGKLKARADEYVGTPVEPALLAERVAAVLAASSELRVARTRVIELLQHSQVDAREDTVSAPRHARAPEARRPAPPERKSSSALWLLVALAAIAGGAWMIHAGLAREAPPTANVQP